MELNDVERLSTHGLSLLKPRVMEGPDYLNFEEITIAVRAMTWLYSWCHSG